MNPLAIRTMVLTIGAAVVFGTGWSINGWRLGKQIAQIERNHVAAMAAASEVARLRERSLEKQVEDARNEAVKREAVLRRDAANSRRSADGLRDELADLRRQLPELAADACRRRADALADILNQCATRYRELAETTDRINSDRQTLMEAWPK